MHALLQLHAYTFVRPQNIREAKWSEFDIERMLWTILAAKVKMRRLHIVPLVALNLSVQPPLVFSPVPSERTAASS